MSERAERLTREVLRVTHHGSGLDELRRALDAVLAPVIGWDSAAWSTLDPATLLFTSCVVVGRTADSKGEAAIFAGEFDSTEVNSYRSLASRQVPAAALRATTAGSPETSVRWRTVLVPRGIHDELRLVAVDRGHAWGAVTAYRHDGANETAFSADDVADLAALSAPIADGLRRAMFVDAAADVAFSGVGIVVVGPDGQVQDCSETGSRWLETLGAKADLPAVLRSVAVAARSAASGGAVVPACARLAHPSGGWVLVHGSAMSGSDQVTLLIEVAVEHHLADVLVRAYGLTPREREVTELILRGRSTDEIARELVVSPHTVAVHAKSILAKVGVSSRRDLVAELYGRHYAPATAAAALPSPYGWYR